MIFTKANLTSLLPLYDETTPDAGKGFHYYFPNSPEATHDRTTLRRLDLLAQAVRDSVPFGLSAEAANLAQFIAQDISGGAGLTAMPAARNGAKPLPRSEVIHRMGNHRSGALDLDTVYGGSLKQGNYGRKLTSLLRHPTEKGKMLVAPFTEMADQMFESRMSVFATEEPQSRSAKSPTDIRDLFFQVDAIGNLHTPDGACPLGSEIDKSDTQSVAALHRMFLQFHNVIAETYAQQSAANSGSEALFERARDLVRWQYQWLVVNVFLRQICHAETLDQVIAEEAPLYRHLASAVPVDPNGHLPIPLEFSAAAFRVTEPGSATDALLTGHQVNLPSAQSCLAEILQTTGVALQSLSTSQLTSGATGRALTQSGLVQDTPLWFYIHKEAEVLGKGKTLGPLGTALVANTLIGLLVVDDTSFWHHGNTVHGRWSPAQGILPNGRMISSLEDLREVLG